MATAMYRPAFTRRSPSTSSSNASISSISSSTSSVRALYSRDGQGFDFSSKYPSAGIEAESLVARPAFTRAIYSKDGRNVTDFSQSYKFSPQQTLTTTAAAAAARTPFTRSTYSKDGRGMGIDFYASYKGRQ